MATAQQYCPNITELLEGMYERQQQSIINFYEKYGYHPIVFNEGYNTGNKFVRTGKYNSKNIANVDAIR